MVAYPPLQLPWLARRILEPSRCHGIHPVRRLRPRPGARVGCLPELVFDVLGGMGVFDRQYMSVGGVFESVNRRGCGSGGISIWGGFRFM